MDNADGTIDVSEKPVSQRGAVAECVLTAPPDAIRAVQDNSLPKRDPIATARAAGLLAAKKTPDLIPHCHPIAVTDVRFDFLFAENAITVRCRVTARDRTGPEMEALCGAALAALTLYDMLKGICRGAQITRAALVEKQGGKSGHWRAGETDG